MATGDDRTPLEPRSGSAEGVKPARFNDDRTRIIKQDSYDERTTLPLFVTFASSTSVDSASGIKDALR